MKKYFLSTRMHTHNLLLACVENKLTYIYIIILILINLHNQKKNNNNKK